MASIEQPTPEMLLRVTFDLTQVTTEMGLPMGTAYRRRALFESMSDEGKLTPEELAALRFYRAAFDRSERSPVGCCLADGGLGQRGARQESFMSATPAILEAKRRLSLCENALDSTVTTMRSFVLEDRSFSHIAMERFGFRKQQWIIDPSKIDPDRADWIHEEQPLITNTGKPLKPEQTRHVFRERIVPRSGRHREAIRQEFRRGLALLVGAVDRIARGGETAEIWIHPREDGTAIVHHGSCAPLGTYRLWGSAPVVDAVLNILLAHNGDSLVFPSPVVALNALTKADDGRLRRLTDEELAA